MEEELHTEQQFLHMAKEGEEMVTEGEDEEQSNYVKNKNQQPSNLPLN